MHFFSSILFKSRSPTLFPSSTTMETATNSQEEETGLKSLTSPTNHNHSSMINRFNISPQSSSASSSCTSPSSPVSTSPCCSSSSSSSVYSVDDDITVSTDETPVTNHHQKQEEEEITEKPFYDHRKNVIIVRNQRSGIRREFPPPIPLLARTENLPCHMPWVLKRSYKDGRLIIKEVNVKHHEYFRAHRSNGRLTLQLMHMNQLTIHPPPNDTSSTTPTTDDIEEEEEEEDNVDVNDLVDFDNDDKDEKKNEDNKKDDDENDGVLSEQEQGSDEEEEVEKVERPSADPLHHIRQRFRPSEQPSSSLPQCQIHETKEGKQDFDGEILRNCSQPLILASSLPEGRVRGMCQPNDHRKSNLFRLPIVSVRPVHS